MQLPLPSQELGETQPGGSCSPPPTLLQLKLLLPPVHVVQTVVHSASLAAQFDAGPTVLQ